MGSEAPHHVLMVTFPGQGHVNPLLRLAKRLASAGLFVTLSTVDTIGHMMRKSSNPPPETPVNIGQGQFQFQFFPDGWEADDPRRYDLDSYVLQLETAGRDNFVHLINKQSVLGRPVCCIINNPFVPWASDVAASLGIPSALLWVQSCAVYSIYHHYYHNSAPFPSQQHPDLSVQIPGLPNLQSHEIPSFLHPFSPKPLQPLRDVIIKQFKNLEKPFCVLVDSFEELEEEAMKPLSGIIPIRPIGPLYKFKADGDVRGDMWSAAEECIEWLDSKPAGSVVYVSFGSVVYLGKEQIEEIAKGLLHSGQFFLWALKPPAKAMNLDGGRVPEGFVEQAQGKGLVVEWCPQERVLAHPAVGCFVTHCGWNSSMEILSSGVPVIAAPQWGDQVTNAKFLVEVYGVGVRLLRNDADLKILTSEMVEKCIVEVMQGVAAEENRRNCLKWKKAAEVAVAEGGSSWRNLITFVDEIKQMSLAPKANVTGKVNCNV